MFTNYIQMYFLIGNKRVEAFEGRRLKLGDTHPHTLESWHNLIELYEVWNKPEEAEKWRAKLPQTAAVQE
jgi:hypothetical protein